jgi:hypothetical protein
VCSEHLKNREIIPHISKTQKQKICDNCVKGVTPAMNILAAANAASNPAKGDDDDKDEDEPEKVSVNPVKLQQMRLSAKFATNAPLIPPPADDNVPALPPPPVPTHAPPPVPGGVAPPIPSSEPPAETPNKSVVAKKSLYSKRRSVGKCY